MRHCLGGKGPVRVGFVECGTDQLVFKCTWPCGWLQGAGKKFGDISEEEEVVGFLWPAISWNKRGRGVAFCSQIVIVVTGWGAVGAPCPPWQRVSHAITNFEYLVLEVEVFLSSPGHSDPPPTPQPPPQSI